MFDSHTLHRHLHNKCRWAFNKAYKYYIFPLSLKKNHLTTETNVFELVTTGKPRFDKIPIGILVYS